jgi:hypothetical protein
MRTPLEALLQAMVTGGWATQSGGSVESPTGAYASVSVLPSEVGECIDAFEDVVAMYSLDAYTQLVGEWLVVEDEQGNVAITNYGLPSHLARAFNALDAQFTAWDMQNG